MPKINRLHVFLFENHIMCMSSYKTIFKLINRFSPFFRIKMHLNILHATFSVYLDLGGGQ